MTDTHEATTLVTCAITITGKLLDDLKRNGATAEHALFVLRLTKATLEHSDPNNPALKSICQALREIKNGSASIPGKTVSTACRAVSEIVDKRPRPRTTPPQTTSPQTTQSPRASAGKRPAHKTRTATTPPRTPQSPGANAGKATSWAAQTMTRLPKVTGPKVTGSKVTEPKVTESRVRFKEPEVEVVGPIVGMNPEYKLIAIDDNGIGITGIDVTRKFPNGYEDCMPLSDVVFEDDASEARMICRLLSKIAEEDGSDIDDVLVFASDQVKGWFGDVGEVNARLQAKRHSEQADWGEPDADWE